MQSILKTICSGHGWNLLQYRTVTGGDINTCYKLETQQGPFFIKINLAERFPDMLSAEAKGLELLAASATFEIPKVIFTGTQQLHQYLILEWVEPGRPTKEYWETFAQHLAQLHSKTQPQFGLHFDNYIGSLPQSNNLSDSFAEFYSQSRIIPLVQRLVKNGIYTPQTEKAFEHFCLNLPNLVPEEKPALLHGDLWSGNYMINEKGLPVLIDPAPYYGHREIDIAMMHLFGGFDPLVFHHYQNLFPMEAGWKNRIPLFQLYPTLVHAVLFGEPYVSNAKHILKRFI